MNPERVSSPEKVLQDLVKCAHCNDYLWFSSDGYLTCQCKEFPYREFSPEMVLTKILEDLTSKLDKTEFLDTLTKTTNSALKEDGFQFSEQEVLKIVQKTLSNAVMSGNEENIKRTITLLVEEVIIHHSGTLELILVSTH